MILADFLKALRQIGDPRFRRVLVLGVALSLALLAGVWVLLLAAIGAFVPDSVTLPLIGQVGGIDRLLGWGSALLMVVASVFLMVPVASAFTSFMLDGVAQAVEDRHYPALPAPRVAGWAETVVETATFLALLVTINLAALVAYPFAGPLAPFLFWAVNGFMLGREYFTLVAQRRMPREDAVMLRRRHWPAVWAAGTLMAAPLSIPFVNLLVPVMGAATFTHLFHRLARR